jgi:hypothetical protein
MSGTCSEVSSTGSDMSRMGSVLTTRGLGLDDLMSERFDLEVLSRSSNIASCARRRLDFSSSERVGFGGIETGSDRVTTRSSTSGRRGDNEELEFDDIDNDSGLHVSTVLNDGAGSAVCKTSVVRGLGTPFIRRYPDPSMQSTYDTEMIWNCVIHAKFMKIM